MWFCFLCNSFELNFQAYAKRINDAKAMMPQLKPVHDVLLILMAFI